MQNRKVELGMMKEKLFPTVIHSFTSSLASHHSTWWWHSPVGTSWSSFLAFYSIKSCVNFWNDIAVSKLFKNIEFSQKIQLLSFFHFRPDSDLRHLNSNMAAVWVKIVSSWLCLALYTWTLAAPALFPDRDFS